jgi:hypothetical protein
MYVDVANRIYNQIKDFEISLPDADFLKMAIAINVAIYFEDKMSGIGLWNAFVSKHMQMYSRQLPFFEDIEELDSDDINAQEVQLLVWLVVSREFDERFLNPITMANSLGNVISDILNEYEDVEVNDELYDYIYDKSKANDYFKLKQNLFWLRRSYLLSSPLSDERFFDMMDSFAQHFNKSESAYYADTTFSMTTEIGPLAIEPHIWLAEMYRNNGLIAEADRLSNLEYCQQDIFEVTKIDSSYAILKDSDGEEYKLLNTFPDLFREGSFVSTALVKYGNYDWEINGVLFNSQKVSYDKACERRQKLKYSYEHSYPMFMERTGGKRLLFFTKSSQIEEWLKKISEGIDTNGFMMPGGEQVAFISKKAGIIFAPNIVHAVKSDDNPYYKKCDGRKMHSETMNAVINDEVTHPEMLQYLLQNNMLQDGDISGSLRSEMGNRIFTQNIDFIARCHRRHKYHDHDF